MLQLIIEWIMKHGKLNENHEIRTKKNLNKSIAKA